MSIQILKDADMVLSPCGRPEPPPGYRWVDLPYCLTFQATITPGFSPATILSKIENKARVPFLCRGISFSQSGPALPFRIWFNGRNLEQTVSAANFAQSGAGLRTLMPEIRVGPMQKIGIELGSS
jgi:hypothetical protein